MLDVEENAIAIHKAISRLLNEPDGVVVGFDSKIRFSELVREIKRGNFDIPFFGKKEWIREKIVTDASMYQFLAAYIELQMVHRGEWLRWSGYGTSLSEKNIPPQIHDFITSVRYPVYVVIQLGVDRDEFEGLLEGL